MTIHKILLQRKVAASKLTELMESQSSFSYLRLGDMEAAYLVSVQEGRTDDSPFDEKEDLVTSNAAFDSPGLSFRYYSRLLYAYETCDYLDFYDGVHEAKPYLRRLKLDRSPTLHRNPGPETSQVFFDWLVYEFRSYIDRHRCLLAGAESGILENLFQDSRYREIASSFWSENACPIFYPYWQEFKGLDKNLDKIKNCIAKFIIEKNVDTLFLSLGGAAKIICTELSKELNIRTFDFGSLMRGLTYSGSSGNHFRHCSHHPFFFRIPLRIYLPALDKALPFMTPAQRVIKIHAQLVRELAKKEFGRSIRSPFYHPELIDRSKENLTKFYSEYQFYKEEVKVTRIEDDPKANLEIRNFERWLLENGISWRGKLYVTWRETKNLIKKTLGIKRR